MNTVPHATTIVAVRRGDKVAMAGDGQVTLGDTVMKHGAVKVRRLGKKKNVLGGFAGAAADAFQLFDRFETKLDEYNGNLTRAAVELAKDWRSDKVLRRLEALLLVADAETTLLLSGTGDVIEPDNGVIAIGSGGSYAQAAATALMDHTRMAPAKIAREAMLIAGNICIYTNDRVSVEEL